MNINNKLGALLIEEGRDTPKVMFDPGNNVFEISGNSFPENANLFYNQVVNWLSKYLENPNSISVFEFNFIIINSATLKIIFDILLKLEHKYKSEINIKVVWSFKDCDEEIIKRGVEFDQMIDIPFNFKF